MDQKTAHLPLPLFDFFQNLLDWEKNELQRVVLTSESYEVLMDGLKNCPFPLETPDDYFRLCKLLWLKPCHDEVAFRQRFDSYWTHLVAQLEAQKKVAETKKQKKSETVSSRDLEEKQEKAKSQKEETALSNPTKPTVSATNENELTDFWVSFEQNTEGVESTATASVAPPVRFSFFDKNKFLPLDIRRLYQMLLSVRRISFDGERSDWDFDGSLNNIIRNGYLSEFAYRRQARQWLGVHLLLDYGGSMVAFDHFSDLMAAFVQEVGNENSFVWYCHNTPTDTVFRDKNELDAITLDEWFKILDNTAPAQILIFSDAGAARGYRSSDRIEATQAFLSKLKKHRIAWVNPMPLNRWSGTSAADIEKKVPMFDATDANFVAAMQKIKGKN
ncbi:MAG: hypothetical protein JNL70_11065 [Saprospiraceae bacterium]|nr:hypothetical protein [Saprospiraceae bacterium]